MLSSNSLDRYQAAQSTVHRLDPRVKVVVTVLFILSNALLPDGAWLAFGLAWLLLLCVNFATKLGIWYTLRRSFVALPFALAAVTAIIALPGQPIFSWQLGGWTVTGTDAGMLRFVSIVIRSWLSVQLAILLVATTTFPDLMQALRRLHLPALIVAIVSLMYRYLFVLSEEMQRLLRARDARSAQIVGYRSGGTLAWRAQVAGNIAGQLFLRSYERSDRIYQAMLARGYTGQWRSLNRQQMQQIDWMILVVALIGLAVIQFLGWMMH